jgi:putative nucleotidyltransferase with HDIG domain
MSFTPDFEQQGQIADSMRRSQTTMSHRERVAAVVIDGGFVAVAAVLWAIQPPGSIELWPSLLCVVLLAISTRVEFDLPWGFTVATQLAFVPLLFSMPVTLVPFAVVVALMLATLPELIGDDDFQRSRLVLRLGNAWFAIGPVAVFVIAGTSPQNASGWLLIAALVAQFAVDLAASAVRAVISLASSWSESLSGTWAYAIDAALSPIALVVAKVTPQAPYAPLAMLPLLALLYVFAQERKARLKQMFELSDAYHGTALVLGDVVEADDGYTGEHSRGVVRLCLDVAEQLGLSTDQKRNLEFGALLHDVGKIAIPKEIINKPGKLDDHEWTVIKTHTVEGQKLLETVGGFMKDVGAIVRSHHERWDGQGYPDGLAGEGIRLESRIISACDTWNAMRTDRSYRQRLPFEKAEAEMLAIAGTQLDPRVVAALLIAVEPERETEPVTVPEVAPEPARI